MQHDEDGHQVHGHDEKRQPAIGLVVAAGPLPLASAALATPVPARYAYTLSEKGKALGDR